MDAAIWHIAAMVFSGLSTCVAVLIMHVVSSIERSQASLTADVSEVREKVARMEGLLTRNEGRIT